MLLGVIAADKEIEERGLDMEIFGLVHDSIIAKVSEDSVGTYNELIDRNIQEARSNWDPSMGTLSIPGAPIGIDSDSEVGGSRDYGCGKLAKVYPFLACVDDWDDRATTKCKSVLEALKTGNTRDLDHEDPVIIAALKYPNELLSVLG